LDNSTAASISRRRRSRSSQSKRLLHGLFGLTQASAGNGLADKGLLVGGAMSTTGSAHRDYAVQARISTLISTLRIRRNTRTRELVSRLIHRNRRRSPLQRKDPR
jgi:hypothetical protein